MPQPWETAPPQLDVTGQGGKMPWETPFPGTESDHPGAQSIARGLTQNAPGMDKVQNPVDGFLAGIHVGAAESAIGTAVRGGAPDPTLPANAGFAQKLGQAIGGGLDLPLNIIGAIGGAAAASEAGPAGAAAGGGAGAFALPEAVRQAAQDAYKLGQEGHPVSSTDFVRMIAHNAWEVGKKSVVGAVAGPAAKFAEYAAPLWKTTAGVLGFTGAATAAQSAIAGKLPDAEDFAASTIAALGFGVAAHVAEGGAARLNETGKRYASNLSEVNRQTGFTPHEAILAASGDAKLDQELKTQDVNGDPNLEKFNVVRPQEEPPYERVKPAANGLVVARRMPDGTVKYGKPGDMHFNLYGDDELEQQAVGSVHMDQADMGFAQPGGKFMSREEAAAFLGKSGRLESVRNEAEARGEAIPAFGRKGEIQEPPEFDGSPAAIQRHVEQLLPQIRGLEASGDTAISPKGAVGRYQIMPGTARQYGFDPAKLSDPKYNEQVARTVLADLSRRFNGDTEAILVAYNSGPTRAFRFIRDGRDTADLPMETQRYLARGGFGGKGGEPPGPFGKRPSAPEPEGPGGERPGSSATAAADYDAKLGRDPDPVRTGTGLMRQVVSELESARQIDRTLVKAGLLDQTRDLGVEDMFRQTYASEDRLTYMVNKGNIDPITFNEKPGTSLLGDDGVIQNMKDAGGNVRDFNIYRIAQRTVDLAERGIDMGIMKEKDARAVLEDPAYKKYEPINAKMQMWKRGGLEYGRDSSLFSQKQIDAMEAASSHVSIRRILGDDDGFTTGGFAGNRGFNVSNPLKRMEGSDRQITDPLMADVDNMRQIIRMSDRNRAIGNVLSIPSLVKALKLKRVNVAGAAIAEPGSNVFKPYSMQPPEELAPFEHLAHQKDFGEKDPNSFTYFRDGKKETWVAESPEIAELMRGADARISPITVKVLGHELDIMKAMALPATLERAGIVGAVDFPIRVFQKHALTAWMQDPLHPPPIITGLQGLTQAIVKGPEYWDLVRRGGKAGSFSSEDLTNQVNKAIGDMGALQETGAYEKAMNFVATPLHLMQMANETLATAERIGYVKRAKAVYDIDDVKAATMSRGAFLDFNERAVNGAARWFAQNVPFFKSMTLGLKLVRDGIETTPKGFAVAASGFVGLSAALYALNLYQDKFIDDPTKRWSSMAQTTRDLYLVTPQMGPNQTRFKLGLPYVIGPLLHVPVQRALQRIFEDDPHAFDGMLAAMASDVTPSFLPAAVRPVLEQMTNHNFFTGQPLVSDHLKDLTPDEQYTDSTSEVAKQISAKLSTHRGIGVADVSPVVVDNYVNEYTGTGGSALLHMLDSKSHDLKDWKDQTFLRGFVVQNPRFNTKQVDDFYKDAAAFSAQNKDAVEEIKRGDPMGLADKSLAGRKAQVAVNFEHALNVIRTAASAAEQNKEMTKDEKRQIANQLYQDAWHISVMGSQILHDKTPDLNEANSLQSKIEGDVGAAHGTQ